MLRLLLPESRDLTFYLAAEEFAASGRYSGDIMFIWRVAPTVIIGRNQDLFSEVDLGYCASHGINVVRRKSGGGCVFSDWGNIMISCITGSGKADEVFGRYVSGLVSALSSLGIPAVRSGRNDVVVGERKVSGNAFRMLPERSVIHGTLLYDTDCSVMSAAITPSRSKLAGRGVRSVRSRVTNLKGMISCSSAAGSLGVHDIQSLVDYLGRFFCDSEIHLTEQDLEAVTDIEKTYLDRAYLFGRRHCGTFMHSGRIPEVGEVCVSVSLEGNSVSDVHLSGDYFLLDGITPEILDSRLMDVLSGSRPDKAELEDRLSSLDMGRMVHNMTSRHLLGLLLSALHIPKA